MKTRSKFDYGMSVKVLSCAPGRYSPGEFGSIISIHEVISEEHAKTIGVPIGKIAIGIEFGDGSDIEVPETLLQILDKNE